MFVTIMEDVKKCYPIVLVCEVSDRFIKGLKRGFKVNLYPEIIIMGVIL